MSTKLIITHREHAWGECFEGHMSGPTLRDVIAVLGEGEGPGDKTDGEWSFKDQNGRSASLWRREYGTVFSFWGDRTLLVDLFPNAKID